MKSNFNTLFNQDFDLKEPTIGHFERFEKRTSKSPKKKIVSWKWISIAASIVLIFGIWLGKNEPVNNLDLADISPKMEETQDYFTSVIRTEIEKINLEKTDENKKIIDDSFLRLDRLEEQYGKLMIELKESNQDKRVIFAMISNYQQRIEILQNLMNQLETLKEFKTTNYESYI